MLQSALPHDQNTPTKGFQPFPDFPVTFDVAAEFSLPRARVIIRDCGIEAAFMAMPEAPMNKDDHLELPKHEVRSARQPLDVLPESKAHSMQNTSNEAFRPGILGANTGHHPAARWSVDYVRHSVLIGARSSSDWSILAEPCSENQRR